MNYHDDYSAVSKSMLTTFRRSPVEYRETYLRRTMEPKRPSAVMQVGTLCHVCLLERRELDELAVVYPDHCLKANGDLNGKVAAEFRASAGDLVCLKAEAYEEIATLLGEMRKTVLGPAIEAASHLEHRFDATVDGVACKAKPDILADMDGHVLAYDLKFMADVSHAAFARSARRFAYWLQDAHYSRVLYSVLGKPVVFRFFACETQYPFRVQAYWYEARSREIATEMHQATLARLRRCLETDVWEDDWQNEISLAPWELEDDEQLVEFGEADE